MGSLQASLRRLLGHQELDTTRHWAARVASFERENRALAGRGGSPWVLLGDSLIERVPRPLLSCADRRFVNRGICADHLEGGEGGGIIARLESERLAPDPSRVFVLAGINDVGDHPEQPSLVIDRYRRVLDRLRGLHPRAAVTVMTLLPVRAPHAHLSEPVLRVNRELVQVAAAHGADLFDLHARFVDAAGALARPFSKDGLHLTPLAYVRLALLLRRIAGRAPRAASAGLADTP